MMNRAEADRFKALEDENVALKEIIKRLCRTVRSTVKCRPKSAALDSILESVEMTEKNLKEMETQESETQESETIE